MSLTCIVSAKGSPGVTLVALGLAAATSTGEHHRKVLLEADPSGGALAIRFGLGRNPGLTSLTAAGAHGLARDDLWSHVQELPGGLGVICAPERADRSRSALAAGAAALGRWLADRDDLSTIADCGRYAPGDPASALVEAASKVYMVARPTAEQIQPAAAAAQHLAAMSIDVAWVLIGERPHSAAEVSGTTAIPVARVLPDDPRGAQLLEGGNSTARRANLLARHFVRWARELTEPGDHESVVPDISEQRQDPPSPVTR